MPAMLLLQERWLQLIKKIPNVANGVLTVEWNPEILPSFVAVHAVAGVDG